MLGTKLCWRLFLVLIGQKIKQPLVGKVEGSTLAKVFSGFFYFGKENSSLKDRRIERINIKEVSSIGGYRCHP